MIHRAFAFVLLAIGCLFGQGNAVAQTDPLPSWSDGAKQTITDFVARVTREGGLDYVKPAERIATFDNDGTLWTEQPAYFQLAFAIDRVKALAPKHPDWKALAGVIVGLMKDDTELFKQFSDNPEFKRWLTDASDQ